MSEYVENILITEIEEVKEAMRKMTDSLTRERLNLSLALNYMNNKKGAQHYLLNPELVYEDELVVVYEGELKEDLKNSDKIASIRANEMACIERVEDVGVVPEDDKTHLMWTKDFVQDKEFGI